MWTKIKYLRYFCNIQFGYNKQKTNTKTKTLLGLSVQTEVIHCKSIKISINILGLFLWWNKVKEKK